MGRISLFDSSDPRDSVSLLGLFTEIRGITTGEKERRLGLDFVGLTDKGTNVHGLVDRVALSECKTADGFAMNESVLFHIFNVDLYKDPESVELANFYLTDDGYVGIDFRRVYHADRQDSKGLRRFIMIEIDNEVYLTDVYGLSTATLHHKTDRDRNDLGLQWENYISIIKNGVAFIR